MTLILHETNYNHKKYGSVKLPLFSITNFKDAHKFYVSLIQGDSLLLLLEMIEKKILK